MTRTGVPPLKRILALGRDNWDRAETRARCPGCVSEGHGLRHACLGSGSLYLRE